LKNLPIYFGLFLTVTFWGASFVATKIALKTLMPVTIIVLRFGIGFLLILFIHILKRDLGGIRLRDLPMLALLGFLGVTFHQWLQVTGLRTAQATVGSWIVATIPIYVAIMGWSLLKERLGGKRVLGIAIAFISTLVVVGDGKPLALFTGEEGTIGDFLFLLSSINWAIFTILSRNILRGRDLVSREGDPEHSGESKKPLISIMIVLAFGWFFSLIWFAFEGNVSDLSQLKGEGLWAILFLGIACSGLAYIFWYKALSVIDATQVGVFLYFEPIVTALLARPLLGEVMGFVGMAGGLGILIGIWIVNRG
jgi:drug/metabolite transporter (DMT)-like permease